MCQGDGVDVYDGAVLELVNSKHFVFITTVFARLFDLLQCSLQKTVCKQAILMGIKHFNRCPHMLATKWILRLGTTKYLPGADRRMHDYSFAFG